MWAPVFVRRVYVVFCNVACENARTMCQHDGRDVRPKEHHTECVFPVPLVVLMRVYAEEKGTGTKYATRESISHKYGSSLSTL